MKTRKEGSKARLLGLSCMALVLTAFGVTGVRADAADAKKAPPLVNLAEEKDVKVTVGENMDLKNADLLTDGDKYYLQHDATGNKEGNNWENYQDRNRSHQHRRREKRCVGAGGFGRILSVGSHQPETTGI